MGNFGGLQIIQKCGVVFGARWNEKWEVVHDYVETMEELALFRGSKYVQSRIGDSYQNVQHFLKEGREVLFSGTPCQIAGLKRFLQKEYENLLTVDFICHGVPSPLVWERYKNSILGANSFKSIQFRDKSNGWKRYCFRAEIDTGFVICETFYNNTYMRGFLKDLYLRPACHDCPSKSLRSGADITIADYWGIQNVHPEFDDDRGTNLVIVNSNKGADIYKCINLESIISDKRAFIYNPSIHKSSIPHKKRIKFFSVLSDEKKLIIPKIIKFTKTPLFVKFRNKIRKYL